MSFEAFDRDGFAVIPGLFSEDETNLLCDYTKCLLELNVKRASDKKISSVIPELYHEIDSIDHHMVASSTYRYFIPPSDITHIIEKPPLLDLLKSFSSSSSLTRWQDPGYGWLGYRLVRPNSNDG